MISYSLYVDTAVYLFIYMFIYNSSLILLFWSFFNTILIEFKNLYSFSSMGFNSYFLLFITIILLSIAGVPPFIGFFSKLIILISVSNSNFFLFYSLFFVILFLGLYFYMQNIKFLHSTNLTFTNYAFVLNERLILFFYYFSNTLIIFTIFGLFTIDDVILFFYWLFYNCY